MSAGIFILFGEIHSHFDCNNTVLTDFRLNRCVIFVEDGAIIGQRTEYRYSTWKADQLNGTVVDQRLSCRNCQGFRSVSGQCTVFRNRTGKLQCFALHTVLRSRYRHIARGVELQSRAVPNAVYAESIAPRAADR